MFGANQQSILLVQKGKLMELKHLHLYIVSIITALTLILGTQVYAVSLEEVSYTLLGSEWYPFEHVDKFIPTITDTTSATNRLPD